MNLTTGVLIGFASGLSSGMIQFVTKMKDENNDGVRDWRDLSIKKLLQTGILSGISAAYLAGFGFPIDPFLLGAISAGIEKMIGIVLKFLGQFFKLQ